MDISVTVNHALAHTQEDEVCSMRCPKEIKPVKLFVCQWSTCVRGGLQGANQLQPSTVILWHVGPRSLNNGPGYRRAN